MNKIKKPRKILRCEDISPTLRSIKNDKNHGKIRVIGKNTYKQVGSDMLYCIKTSRIIKFGSLELD